MATTSTTLHGVTRTTLGAREKFKLTQFIVAKYKALNLSDVDFAKKAEEELGLPVTAAHIQYTRRQFDIPANRAAVGMPNSEVLQRIEALEQELEFLRREVKECLHINGRKA